MTKIVGIGNALVDVLALLKDETLLSDAKLVKGGMTLIDDGQQHILREMMTGLDVRKSTGGSACNAVLALANLGTRVGFVGKVGSDELGRFFEENCHHVGIDARLMHTERPTGVANTFISPDGERTFGTCLGAAASMEASDITPDLFEGAGILHIEGYLVQNHELMEAICRAGKASGAQLSIDLASYNVVATDLPFFRHLVSDYMDIVFANEEESAAFTEGKAPADALREIAGMGCLAIVKQGSRGAAAMEGSEEASVAAHHVPVVDTTAAGDFFAGGFLHAYAKGASLAQCLQTGATLGEHIIGVVGTQLSDTTWDNIRETVGEILNP